MLPNVCEFYEEFLAHHPLPAYDYHYVSYVHGDLNAANSCDGAARRRSEARPWS